MELPAFTGREAGRDFGSSTNSRHHFTITFGNSITVSRHAESAHGMKVLPASAALKTGLQEIGQRLTGEWLMSDIDPFAIVTGTTPNPSSEVLGDEFQDFDGLVIDFHCCLTRSWFLPQCFRLN